jgi:septal ring-binding cell division protein DamX
MLERGGSDDDAIELIRHAADKGYAPAKRYLGIGQRADNQSQLAQQAAISSSGKVLGSVRSEPWINRQRDQNWTIQLLAFKKKEQVLEFVTEHSLQRKAAYFSESTGSNVFYKLVYGSFDSKDKAALARKSLSPALRQHGPWLRNWSSVHKITKQ